jgi:sarcosine oxidase subunit alpha
MNQPPESSPAALTFTFEGRRMTARPGQSVAGALHQNGVRVLTRSFKLRRPRGYTCGYGVCGNCPLTVDGLTGVTACVQPVTGDEQVRRERGWPSADHDVFRAADVFARFLVAGFQFRLFRRQPRLAHLAERVMALVAGAGRMPSEEAAAAVRATRVEQHAPQLLVVGGGLSGLRAAQVAADGGATVLLVHRGPLGGRALGRTSVDASSSDGVVADADVAQALAETVRAHPLVRVVDGTVVARFDARSVIAVGDRVRHEIDTDAVVIATGSYDVPTLFPGNDKPGVMLPAAARKLVHVERVPLGRDVVVAGPRAGMLADELLDAGVPVRLVVLPDGDASDVRELAARGVAVGSGRVTRARGRHTLTSVEVLLDGRRVRRRCDVLVVDAGERPAEELALQSAYVDHGDTDADGPTPSPTTVVVGSARGTHQDERDAAEAVRAVARLVRPPHHREDSLP